MYLQEILEVAIGLVFVWLVISIATMSLQEWVGNAVNLRAKDLERAVIQMLGSKELARRFYEYPLISNLFNLPNRTGSKGRLPSYIPAAKFSATVFELIVQAGTDNSPILAVSDEIQKEMVFIESPEQRHLAAQDWEAILDTVRNFTSSGLGSSGLDSLKFQLQTFGDKYPELKTSIDELLPKVDAYYSQVVESGPTSADSAGDRGLAVRQFQLGAAGLQSDNPRLSDSASAILKQTNANGLGGGQAASDIRFNLESWFNDAMDRLSGTFKRRAQFIAFLIGLIIAVILNVDSIFVANSLWREPTLRQAIIAQAQDFASTPCQSATPGAAGPLENISALKTQLQVLSIPFGWNIISFDTSGRQCSLLPIRSGQVWGIPSYDSQGNPVCSGISNLPVDLNGWLMKVLGVLITGAAAAQGAPFWFDILKKIINVRSTGINPSEQKPVG